MTHIEILIIAGVVLASYSLISMRVATVMQPIRLTVVEDISKWCADPTIPEDVKEDLRFMSGQLFNKSAGWLIVILFPFVVVRHALFSRSKPIEQRWTHPHRKKVLQTIAMGLFSMLASSPLCLLIFFLQLLLSLVLVAPWGWMRSLVSTISSVESHFPSARIWS